MKVYAAILEDDGSVTLEVKGETVNISARAAELFGDEIKEISRGKYLTQVHHAERH